MCIVLNVVPCYKRVKQMDSHQENFEKVIEVEGDEDGGWVDTHHFAGMMLLSLWFALRCLTASLTLRDGHTMNCLPPFSSAVFQKSVFIQSVMLFNRVFLFSWFLIKTLQLCIFPSSCAHRLTQYKSRYCTSHRRRVK